MGVEGYGGLEKLEHDLVEEEVEIDSICQDDVERQTSQQRSLKHMHGDRRRHKKINEASSKWFSCSIIDVERFSCHSEELMEATTLDADELHAMEKEFSRLQEERPH